MKDKIVDILMNELSDVYCNNCCGNDNNEDDEDYNRCEYCHRKSMYWGLSKETAERLANEIINTIFQIKEKDISKE